MNFSGINILLFGNEPQSAIAARAGTTCGARLRLQSAAVSRSTFFPFFFVVYCLLSGTHAARPGAPLSMYLLDSALAGN